MLQLALLRVHWPPDVLLAPMGSEVQDDVTGDVIYRGLKAKVGLYKGEITRIIPHRWAPNSHGFAVAWSLRSRAKLTLGRHGDARVRGRHQERAPSRR